MRSVAALSEGDRGTAIARIRAAAGDGASLLAPLSATLGTLLDAPPLSAGDRSDQMATALADFLIQLARATGGMVLQVDDVQWADPATRRVLRRLASDLGDAPLLLAATARDGDDHREALAGFLADVGPNLRTRSGWYRSMTLRWRNWCRLGCPARRSTRSW